MEQEQWDRCAHAYHEEVVSPFIRGVKNPLFLHLDKSSKHVAEFGCGHFYLGKKLSQLFEKVYASDFSPQMVQIAQKKYGHLPNVNIVCEDMRQMKHQEKFDTIISVNSLLMPSANDIKTALRNMYSSLRQQGTLLLIVPSLESSLYHGLLLYENELEKRDENNARKVAKRRFEKRKYDLFLGHFRDGNDVQKFFYQHEIAYLLQKAGFKDLHFDKVLYPWREGVSGYDPFPNENPMWDWFVKAKK